ncbi:MAG: caspase family protein [Sulfuricellaceae bacterium]
MLQRVIYSLATAILLLAPSLGDAAQKHALLVGVSNYSALNEQLQLKGPSNDVVLMRNVLQQFGFAERDVRVLADGVEGAGSPTREAILGELKRLASTVEEGDFVYLHFSGHGSQQPTKPSKQPPEPDGLDEIFLPADVGKWDGGKGEVMNAVIDSEFGNFTTAMRRRGAFVWAVFDSCHSGSMTRGAAVDDVRYRQVLPQNLGISDSEMQHAQAGAIRTRGAPSAKGGTLVEETLKSKAGGFVAFYAAQSTETTPEEPQPVDQPVRKPYGIFTYTLAQTLATNPNLSYRQAGQQILNRYAARNRFSPTPLFEGSSLDAPVFGSGAGEFKPQWKTRKKGQEWEIPAGALHQLSDGAIFAILPSPAGEEKDIVGYAKAVNTQLLQTGITPVEYANKRAIPASDIPKDAYARLVNSKLALDLNIALPSGGNTPGHAKVERVLDKLAKGKVEGVKINWVKSGLAADIRLTVQDEKIWLLPSSGVIVKSGPHKTHSIDLTADEEKLADTLQTSFQKIAKVINLLRLSSQMASNPIAGNLELKLLHQKAGSRNITEVHAGAIPSFKAGDKLTLALKNNHPRPVDVTVLFVDSEYGVSLMHPSYPGDANRIEAAGKNDTLVEVELNADTLGQESMIMIAVEAEPQALMADFSFLTQTSLDRTRGAGLGGEADDGVHELFQQAGFGGTITQRGASKQTTGAIGKTAIRVFGWRTVK